MEETTKKRLQDLFRTGCSILLIDNSQLMQQEIPAVLEEAAPLSTITVVTKDQYKHIDELVEKRPIDLMFVDGRLGTWHHPQYRAFGPNLVPMLKKKHPNALIISISTDPYVNEKSVENGAHDIIPKTEFHQLTKL